jgi:hypothetical protein
VLAGVVCVFALFWLLRPSARDDLEWEELLSGETAELVAVSPNPPKKLTLMASDTVKVMVRERVTRRELFSGNIQKGASEEIPIQGNVQISFSDGGALSVRREGGEIVRPRKTGKGWVEVVY